MFILQERTSLDLFEDLSAPFYPIYSMQIIILDFLEGEIMRALLLFVDGDLVSSSIELKSTDDSSVAESDYSDVERLHQQWVDLFL